MKWTLFVLYDVYVVVVIDCFFLMIRRPTRSTLDRSSAASDVYKRQVLEDAGVKLSSVASKVLSKSGREMIDALIAGERDCLLYTSPSPRDRTRSRMPSSA